MVLDKFKVDGRSAVITGGGRGIGFACAEAICEAGGNVTILEKDKRLAEEAASTLTEKGYKVATEICDVTQTGSVEAAAESIRKRHGNASILVNSAGVVLGGDVAAEDLKDEVWEGTFDVNMTGSFRCCRAFGRQMLDGGSGSIVNIGSMSGLIVNRPQKNAAYNASKAAVHHLTKSLAAEWADRNVRVNAVAPTYIATEMTADQTTHRERFARWMDSTPMGRMGEPSEIAAVVLFLCSDAASLMTGSILLADAGYTLW
jgi:NAD(P)-dependent dehydrogenase (short-subunit alcohol dehydrogenase family)